MITDPRIVYGARCSWWGSIQEAKGRRNPQGGPPMPCCPHCGGPLFEKPEELSWWAEVKAAAVRNDDEAYVEFIGWLRGKCHPDRGRQGPYGLDIARRLFDRGGS